MTSEAQLSPEATRLLTKLRQTHRVELNPLTIRGHALQILQVADLESLLKGKDPFAEVSEFPFWVKLWEASVVLADFIASQPPEEHGRVLEIGAGLGLPGLAAAAAGHQVTLSDYEPHILDFQRVSAEASGVAQRVEYLLLDWLKPPKLPQFSTIIGAEILFREDFFAPLLSLFKKLLAPGGTIYLAHDIRRKSLPPFMTLAEPDFEIAMSRRRMRSEDEEHTVIISRLTAR